MTVAMVPDVTTKCVFDVFVLCDDADEKTRTEILPQLRKEKFSCCSLQEDGMPGRLALDCAIQLDKHSRRIICVISKTLCADEKIKHIIKVACSDSKTRSKIIALITDGNISHRNGLSCLRVREVPIVYSNANWVLNIKTELMTIIPEYCIYHATRSPSDSLFSKGLLFQHMSFDLYGLLITTKSKNFLVDLSEFSKHINKHTQLNIPKACEDCRFLNDMNTTISLCFSDDFIESEDSKFGDTEFSGSLLELMKCVMDAYNPHCKSNLWSVACSVSGEYKPAHATYINDMFGSVVYALLNKAASKMNVPFLPEFADMNKRRESLRNVVMDDLKRESVAMAGFACISAPDRMQCFQCGWHIPLSAMDLEPLMYHASYMPLCPYVKTILPENQFPTTRVLHKKFDNSELSTTDNGEEDFQEYADAGFYRNGFEHVIECISCGLCIIINNVQTDPWDTHALLSPTCKFLLEKKGREFVKSVNAQRNMEKEPTVVTYALKDFTFDHRLDWPGILFTPDTI